jgi:PhzF family phenazine biosynthesis protein
MGTEILRYAAFTVDGEGGNPAGVVLNARGLNAPQMLAIAAEVGYSESAFLTPRVEEPNVYDVRYFSPLAEVPFCGHATIASALALVERSHADELIFHTPVGFVSITTRNTKAGLVAELTSVAPRIAVPDPDLVSAALDALHWSADDLDPAYPVRLANAGAQHLIFVTRTRKRLAELDYDFDALAAIMGEHGLITLQLIWPESRKRYHSRNPFPPGGVVEDPATGASAAAFGGYLRELGKIGQTAKFTIIQGVDMGRPSEIIVNVIEGEPGVRVSGTASRID